SRSFGLVADRTNRRGTVASAARSPSNSRGPRRMRDRLRSLDQNCGTAASPQRPASIPPLRAAARACRLALAGIVTLALSALIGAEAGAADMVLPGSFDVSPQGSATYTIP